MVRARRAPTPKKSLNRLTLLWIPVLFALTCRIYLLAPETQVTDSDYTILQVERLLAQHTWMLDDVFLPHGVGTAPQVGRVPPAQHSGVPGLPYQIQVLPDRPPGARVTHWYPPGSVLLSLPMVAVAHLWGLTATNPDGSFNLLGETAMQAIFAAIVTALFAAFAFLLAHVYLPALQALLVALSCALGTMALSTSSRALWSSTWGIALFTAALWLQARWEERTRRQLPEARWHVPLLATLLSWTWFCRPSFAVHIAVLGAFVLWRHRALGLRLAAHGGLWLLGFMAFSLTVYGTLLPSYYRHGEFTTAHVWLSLTANLFSPSRGVFIYAPTTLFTGFLLWRFRAQLADRGLALAGLAACGVHVALIAFYPVWWAGHAYGARFFVEWLPWLALLAAQGLAASHGRTLPVPGRVATVQQRRRAGLTLAGFVALSALGVLVNFRGGWAAATFRWNSEPVAINAEPARAVWNWRYPQFLAGLIDWPDPHPAPPLVLGKWQEMGQHGGDRPFLLEGWADDEPGFRWTREPHARLAFGLERPQATQVLLAGAIFSPQARVTQRVIVSINGKPLGQQVLADPLQHVLTFPIPPGVLQADNTLRIDLPDARSPLEFKQSADWRKLGLALRKFQLR